MTTESTPRRTAGEPRGPSAPARRDAVLPILARTVAVAVAAGLGGALLALAVDGRAAFLSVLVGTGLVALVVAAGAVQVNVVASVMPAVALAAALLTYFGQVLVLLFAMVALERSDLLGGALERGWLAGALIGGMLVWMAGQVAWTVRARIPVYELRQPRPEAGRAAS